MSRATESTSKFEVTAARFNSSSQRRPNFLATLSKRPYPIPSRTRKSSFSEPMVLHGQPCGRVGRCRVNSPNGPDENVRAVCFLSVFEPATPLLIADRFPARCWGRRGEPRCAGRDAWRPVTPLRRHAEKPSHSAIQLARAPVRSEPTAATSSRSSPRTSLQPARTIPKPSTQTKCIDFIEHPRRRRSRWSSGQSILDVRCVPGCSQVIA